MAEEKMDRGTARDAINTAWNKIGLPLQKAKEAIEFLGDHEQQIPALEAQVKKLQAEVVTADLQLNQAIARAKGAEQETAAIIAKANEASLKAQTESEAARRIADQEVTAAQARARDAGRLLGEQHEARERALEAAITEKQGKLDAIEARLAAFKEAAAR